MAVQVTVETTAGEQDYTLTAAEPTQPTTGSLLLDVDSPLVTVSGQIGEGYVQVWCSVDGADPTASKDDTGERLQDGTKKLDVPNGARLIFRGVNVPS
jgi:hypothetical protein